MVSSVVTAWGLFSTHIQLSQHKVLCEMMAFVQWDVAGCSESPLWGTGLCC